MGVDEKDSSHLLPFHNPHPGFKSPNVLFTHSCNHLRMVFMLYYDADITAQSPSPAWRTQQQAKRWRIGRTHDFVREWSSRNWSLVHRHCSFVDQISSVSVHSLYVHACSFGWILRSLVWSILVHMGIWSYDFIAASMHCFAGARLPILS